MTMQFVTDERGRAGRYVVAPEKTLPAPNAEVGLPVPVYSELGDGRVRVSTPSGEVLGIAVNRQIAERTMRFLSA